MIVLLSPRALIIGIFLLFSTCIFRYSVSAQTPVNLNDLTAFKSPAGNWKLASKIIPDPKKGSFGWEKGEGILVNAPDRKNKGASLYTNEEFGDFDLELDFLVSKGTSSGIFILDRYLLNLADSWTDIHPKASSNGGVGPTTLDNIAKLGEVYAPRQNVSRAPGLWQHAKIIFRAPRFNASGVKTENARLLRVELNNVVVHDNIELTAPTANAIHQNEVPTAPLRFIGEGGAVAFRNIKIKRYSGIPPTLSDVEYVLYYASHETVPDFTALPEPDESAKLHVLNSSFVRKDQPFLVKYTGKVNILHEDDYIFQRETYGNGVVKINNQIVSDFKEYISKPIHLSPGIYPFEMIYSKALGWLPTSLGLTVSSPDVREFLISDETSLYRETPDPIIIKTPENTILRSFMDIPDGKRVIHNINVGHPSGLHYSYDKGNGTVYQLWRGGFIDAIPMWVSRGDGSSIPVGSRLQLGAPQQSIIKLLSEKDSISTDTTGSGFVSKGYELLQNDQVAFLFSVHGANVKDVLKVIDNGQALQRTVNVENNPGSLYVSIAKSKNIKSLSKGWYQIGDQQYFIRIDHSETIPIIRHIGEYDELIAPIRQQLSYAILY